MRQTIMYVPPLKVNEVGYL